MDFDNMLYRPVANGKEFANLIPKSTCKMKVSGKGDTSFSMQEIKEMAIEYSWQMSKIAKELQASSLTETVENVKDFIYWHFQYKADKEDQLMRSPSCSWHQRYDGIDCKSYSILASAIFLEMGIYHYIRRIKQPAYEPTEWTHVYVIVPVDQETGGLQNGYYAVDGTLFEDDEPLFVEKNDLFMGLQHYRLNAPAEKNIPINGVFDDIDSDSISLSSITDAINNIGNVGDFIKCLGNQAFTDNEYQASVKKIHEYFNNLIAKINSSVVNNDDETFANAIQEFKGNSKVFVKGGEATLADGWRNSCTKDRIRSQIKVLTFYRDTVGAFIDGWLSDNFTKDNTKSGQPREYNNVDTFKRFGIAFINYGSPKFTEQKYYYDPKAKSIPKLEITPYVVEAGKKGSLNILEALGTLATILVKFNGNGQQEPTNPNNPNPNNDTPQDPKKDKPDNTLGYMVAFGLVGFLVIKSMGKPDVKTNTRKRK